MNEFSRTELLIGTEGITKLRNAAVIIFGVGGVGSHCIEALARSGVGKLILVDNDTVSLTNINRQSIAYHSTVGQYKTKVMEQRIHDICPETEVVTYEQFVLPDNIEKLFDQKIDYIVDAIDTVTAKLAIASIADNCRIPLISSMGTGNKLHPERFQITDVYQTSVCPLCKVMRKELKARGIKKLTVLYSDEIPVKASTKMTDESMGSKRSLPGSISFVPPVAGLIIAGVVVREISEIERETEV